MFSSTMPSRPDRVWLVSFWLSFSLSCGLLVASAARVAESDGWMLFGVIVVLALLLPGVVWPRLVRLPYAIWNRLAREYSRAASLILTAICFYTVFAAVRLAGSALRLKSPQPGESLWAPRGTLPSTAYRSEDEYPRSGAPRGWLRAILSWSARPGHQWVVGLIPFLVLLRALDHEERAGVPSDIYTLY